MAYGKIYCLYFLIPFFINLCNTYSGDNKSIIQYKYTNFQDTSNISADTLNNESDENESEDIYSSPLGFWYLKENRIIIQNTDQNTTWKGSEGDIEAEMLRKDQYNIEHSITSSFKWESPPKKLIPGKETIIHAIYKNVDYSSTSPTPTGIIVKIEDNYNTGDNYKEIIHQGKSIKTAANKNENGIFFPPFFDGKSCQLQILIHCFIGNDHYVAAYIYEWVK